MFCRNQPDRYAVAGRIIAIHKTVVTVEPIKDRRNPKPKRLYRYEPFAKGKYLGDRNEITAFTAGLGE